MSAMEMFRPFINFFRPNDKVIDTFSFRMFYKITVGLLLFGSLLIGGNLHFSHSLTCSSMDGSSIEDELLSRYCWMNPTFSVPSVWESSVGVEVVYPGVGTYSKNEEKVYHVHYQWVGIVLFLQAASFYVSHYIWKYTIANKANLIVSKLNLSPVDIDISHPDHRQMYIKASANFLFQNRDLSRELYLTFVLLEMINFVTVIGQIYLTDIFLGGNFFKYGIDVYRAGLPDRTKPLAYHPMMRAFPYLAKCTFYKYGPGGNVVNYDALCFLHTNMFNGWAYLVIWMWYYILLVISGFGVVYNILALISSTVRSFITLKRLPKVDHMLVKNVLYDLDAGGWFLIDLAAKNMNEENFEDVIKILDNKLMLTRKQNQSEQPPPYV